MQIRGNTQIKSGTIEDAQIASGAAIATTKLADGAEFLQRDGSIAMTGSFDAGSQKVINLATGTNSGDAVNKGQLDSAIAAATSGLDVKASVKAASTANLTLSGAQTVDGVSLVANDRILVKNQTTASENGIYVVAAGAWSRSTDADADAEVTPGMFTFVEQGTTNGDTGWLLTTDGTVTVGTTSLTFTQFSGAGSITAGAGLTKTGNTVDVVSGNGGIVVNADDITLTVDATADSLSVGASGVKLKDGTSGQVYVANGSGVFKRVSISGDATLAADGTLTITNPGLQSTNFVFNEVPTGSINGVNTGFTTANTPTAGTVQVFLNGLLQRPTTDYSVSGATITMTSAPETGDALYVHYLK